MAASQQRDAVLDGFAHLSDSLVEVALVAGLRSRRFDACLLAEDFQLGKKFVLIGHWLWGLLLIVRNGF